MDTPFRHAAPRSRLLTGVTLAASILLIAVGAVIPTPWGMLVWGTIPIAAAFTVRGYLVEGERIRVLRPGWSTDLPLAGLRSIRTHPGILRGSIRLFGNGGFFAFAGLFRNAKLGDYRAWVTDRSKAVVLEFEDRTVALSPAHPHLFVEQVERLHGLGPAGAEPDPRRSPVSSGPAEA